MPKIRILIKSASQNETEKPTETKESETDVLYSEKKRAKIASNVYRCSALHSRRSTDWLTDGSVRYEVIESARRGGPSSRKQFPFDGVLLLGRLACVAANE